ncbi:NAD-dependent epimerase/dehydratase family protein [Candidatus Dojkabacteria bacterium]|nr:NAD-dependent epimerase/dehydratase family protein [Candidatus Dojkabacteria bacterium]
MILVTGATGRIGNVLVRELISRNDKVRIFTRKDSDLTPLKGLQYETSVGDVRDFPSVMEAVDGVDYVYHLASLIWISSGNEKKVYEINIGGTKNIIKACVEKNVRKLLYTSSIHAIKELPRGKVITECCSFNPDSTRGAYDRSKARASMAVLRAVKEGLNATIVCPTGVIGPYDYRPSYFGKSMISYVNEQQTAMVEGAYDYVDVRDVVAGMIAAMEKGGKGETYILSGERMTMKQYYKYMEEFSGVKAPAKIIPYKIARFVAGVLAFFKKNPEFTPYSLETLLSNSNISHEKATNELGYSPRDVKESIKDQYEWFKGEGMI